MNIGHLREIRLYELEQAVPLLTTRGRILEIGAGTGWQAKVLADRGLAVNAIDIATDQDRKSTRLNSSHSQQSRMPSSA